MRWVDQYLLEKYQNSKKSGNFPDFLDVKVIRYTIFV